MITDEQAEEIKKQVISQIANFPSPQKEQAVQQIQAMNNEQLEQFLIQNKLIKSAGNNEEDADSVNNLTGNKTGELQQQCIFCTISEKKIPSFEIEENEEALAVLEINPVSKAHTLISQGPIFLKQKNYLLQLFHLQKKLLKELKQSLSQKMFQ